LKIFIKNYTQALSNEWAAKFTHLGEVRMSTEAWDMLLTGPDGKSIRPFQKMAILVNDHDGKQAESCIELKLCVLVGTSHGPHSSRKTISCKKTTKFRKFCQPSASGLILAEKSLAGVQNQPCRAS
jgi:hypothetical protein